MRRVLLLLIPIAGILIAEAPLSWQQGGTGNQSMPLLGQLAVGNGTGYSPIVPSGDLSMTSSGVVTVNTIGGVIPGTAIGTNIGTAGATIPLNNGSNTFSGTDTFSVDPLVPTASPGTNNTQVASTAFVATAVSGAVTSFDTRSGAVTLSSSDVTTALGFTPYNASNPSAYIASGGAPVQSVAGRTGAVTLAVADVSGAAPLASPTLTGTPKAPTQTPGDTSTDIATDAFVGAAVTAGAYTLPAMTTTVLGGLKGNVTLIQKTAAPISTTVGAISLLGAGIAATNSITVAGVTAGDFILASYSGTAPTSITIAGAQATAANTVLVTFAATTALTVSSQSVSLNFLWIH